MLRLISNITQILLNLHVENGNQQYNWMIFSPHTVIFDSDALVMPILQPTSTMLPNQLNPSQLLHAWPPQNTCKNPNLNKVASKTTHSSLINLTDQQAFVFIFSFLLRLTFRYVCLLIISNPTFTIYGYRIYMFPTC